jgi:hypothetical protein
MSLLQSQSRKELHNCDQAGAASRCSSGSNGSAPPYTAQNMVHNMDKYKKMPTFFMKFFSGFLLHRQNKQSANSHEAP